METLLFSTRSIWTMVHGIVLGGGALLALAVALFAMRAMRADDPSAAGLDRESHYLAWAGVVSAAALWGTVLIGTYVTFPPYRATPPVGVTDLAAYPKARLQSRPGTVWLHSFAMETKEHVPWIAVMSSTAVAFVAVRYRSRVLSDARLNGMATALLAVSFVLVAFLSILGVLINKVAPLE